MEAWRTWSRERLEREYSPSSRVESIEPFVRAYAERSRAVLQTLRVRRDIRYGPGPDELLDLVPAAPDAPLVVFFHGGYWQELGKADSLFPAPALVEAGIAYAAVEHTLAPRASLDGIVDQVRRSVAFLAGNAERLGFDGRRIHLVGHSAGAQLAAMVMLAGESGARGGGVLVSGVYDLEPLIETYVNDALGLDEAAALRNSPLRAPGAPAGPAVICWGEIEPSEFARQGRALAARWGSAGTPVDAFEVPGRNHFDLLFDLGDPTTRLGSALREQVRKGGRTAG